VSSWNGHERCKLFDQFQRSKHRVGCSIAPWRFESLRQPSIRQLCQPFDG
jgi:hypothetical protein